MPERKLSVDDSISCIIEEHLKFRGENFLFIRIQDIAKRMHKFYWKYKEVILKEIQEWAERYPQGSIYLDNKGRRWKVGYGQQMCYVYGCFFDKKDLDMLELYRVR